MFCSRLVQVNLCGVANLLFTHIEVVRLRSIDLKDLLEVMYWIAAAERSLGSFTDIAKEGNNRKAFSH